MVSHIFPRRLCLWAVCFLSSCRHSHCCKLRKYCKQPVLTHRQPLTYGRHSISVAVHVINHDMKTAHPHPSCPENWWPVSRKMQHQGKQCFMAWLTSSHRALRTDSHCFMTGTASGWQRFMMSWPMFNVSRRLASCRIRFSSNFCTCQTETRSLWLLSIIYANENVTVSSHFTHTHTHKTHVTFEKKKFTTRVQTNKTLVPWTGPNSEQKNLPLLTPARMTLQTKQTWPKLVC